MSENLVTAEQPLTAGERRLLECYEQLCLTLREDAHELPPFAERGAIKAAAALWQVANGLGELPDQLYDVGA